MATGPRKQKDPQKGATGKKDNGNKKDLVSRWLTDDQVMTAVVGRPTSGAGWDWPAPPIKPIYPQPLVRESQGKRSGRKPAVKRQELDLTPFQDQPGQYGSASSRDRIRAEVEGWRYAGSTGARAKLRTSWGLGPAAVVWQDGPARWPTDYRGYLRARAQDAVSAIKAGRRVFLDTTARPKASKILGVWQDGRQPVPAPVQKPVPKPAPLRQVPAQPSRPAQTPAPTPAVPVMRSVPVLTHRIPKHERGPVALALEKALRESGLTLEQKMEKVEIYRVRHGIRVAILD